MYIHHSESLIYQAISDIFLSRKSPKNPGRNCVLYTRRRRGLDFLCQSGIEELFVVSYYIHILIITGILHVTAKDDRGVFRIELHHVADAVQLLAGHQCGTGAAESINNYRILLRGVLDGIARRSSGLLVG